MGYIVDGCTWTQEAELDVRGGEQKAYAEGAYALCIRAACLHDEASAGDTDAALLLDVITEVVKSWPSEWCLEGNKLAMQVALARRPPTCA